MIKRLNIFVDETGEFGYGVKSSMLYGISFTFHEQDNDISGELNNLNNRLMKIGYTNMIHMSDLIMRRGDYSKFDIKMRKSIFNSIYQFSRKIPVKYHTIIIDKRFIDNGNVLRKQIINEVNQMIKNNEGYFNKFDKIVMYYDNGQEPLGYILDSLFIRFNSYEHRVKFDHVEKRLFQVSDMLTYVDKAIYKHKKNIKYEKSELYFFGNDELRRIAKELNKKRL
jgi:hypothetical protein